jgi:hypothetical protein
MMGFVEEGHHMKIDLCDNEVRHVEECRDSLERKTNMNIMKRG